MKKYLDYLELINEIIDAPNPENDDENFTQAWEFIQSIIDRLPNVFKDADNNDINWDEVEVATNGDELLFKSEEDCWYIANILDEYVFGCTEAHTGEYNREEDERNEEVDANTGWFYIDWD